MSKTFRRKGYEDTQRASWDRRGNKTAGYYTERDGYWYGRQGIDRDTGSNMPIFRKPTRLEYFEEYWRIHGDAGGRNYWTPGRYYRETRQVENRSINKRELCKWLKNDEYEPLFEANPRSHLWDWW